MGSFDKLAFIISIILPLSKFISCEINDTDVNSNVYEETFRTPGENFTLNQHIYTVYFESPVTWIEAYKLCKEDNAELISIDSQREFRFVNAFLKRSGISGTGEPDCVWTSGSDSFEDGIYTWMANGKPISNLFFEPGEPDDDEGKQNCLVLCFWPNLYTKYNLRDTSCTSVAFHLCKKLVVDCDSSSSPAILPDLEPRHLAR